MVINNFTLVCLFLKKIALNTNAELFNPKTKLFKANERVW